jgi:Family of unknown function (DUF6941)
MQAEPVLMPGIMLSDMAIREAGTNKVSLIGCFQRFTLPTLPFRTGLWFATVDVAGIRDAKQFNVTARVEVADSGHVVSSSNVLVGASQPLTPDMIFQVPLPFNGVMFQQEGTYVIVVLIDSEEVGRRKLEVLHTPPTASTQS